MEIPGPRLYAELHLHLGGAVIPRILYSHLLKIKHDGLLPSQLDLANDYLKKFPTYERFERRLTRPCETLSQFLEAHKIVEPLQTQDALPHLITRLLRGCYVFENLAYLELRFNPYFRIPKDTPENQIGAAMRQLVSTVHFAAAASHRDYPIEFTQILCMDSRLPMAINREILAVAKEMKEEVAAVDLAGPNDPYRTRAAELTQLLREAKEAGLKTTAHLFETPDGMIPEMLEFVDRIGHGIQIPLRMPRLLTEIARRGQCLEICPTTYLRTGTLKSYSELKPVFASCFDLGIDIAVCTDNSALNAVRLPTEFERLLTHKVISFVEMERCREAAFRHAFRWNRPTVS
jgi:adenosine deaminase